MGGAQAVGGHRAVHRGVGGCRAVGTGEGGRRAIGSAQAVGGHTGCGLQVEGRQRAETTSLDFAVLPQKGKIVAYCGLSPLPLFLYRMSPVQNSQGFGIKMLGLGFW